MTNNHRVPDLAQFDPRSTTAELRVLRTAVQRARDEARDAKISTRRMQKELADAKRSMQEWRRKYKKITSSLIWRIYLLVGRALYRARYVMRGGQFPTYPAPDLHDETRRKLNNALQSPGNNATPVTELSAEGKSKPRNSSGQFLANALSCATYPIPDLGSLSAVTPRGRIAIVLHLYYPELWPEFRDAIGSIPEPVDLFVSLTAGYSDDAADWIRVDYPEAQIIILENRGRDILPFVTLINSGVLFRYELVCKLHTKRSLYRREGDSWRRNLIGGVLSDPDHVARILAAFDSNPNLGIVVADGSLHKDRSSSLGRVNELCEHIGISRVIAESGYFEFPRGSIFWIRASLLQPIAKLMLTQADFEPEPLSLSGTLPHAIERLIGHMCREARMHALESGDLKT